jgi:hypothetical protein
MTTPKDPLARLVQAALAYDKKIMDAEAVPTADDYNELLDMVKAYAPLPITAPEQEPRVSTVYECQECDWTGTLDDVNGIHHIHHIEEYLEPGDLTPAGVCPECRAVIGVEDPDIPHHTLYHVGVTMRMRGWTVIPPADCPPLPSPTVPAGGFTEGPWHVEPTEGNPNSLSICKAGYGIIAEINRDDEPLVDLDHHDAALIAAAPGLANAVRDCLNAYDKFRDLPWGTLRRAYAAIFPQPKQGA